MTTYTPSQVPNQAFDFIVDGDVYRFAIRYIRGLLYVTIRDEDNNVLVGSLRCANYQWLLPFRRDSVSGNFRFEDANGQYPAYENFGASCQLVHYDADEISAGGV